jgi:hypothetical protein
MVGNLGGMISGKVLNWVEGEMTLKSGRGRGIWYHCEKACIDIIRVIPWDSQKLNSGYEYNLSN